jgi:hypothetical protein
LNTICFGARLIADIFCFIVDDMFLESDIYSPANTTYQVTTADLAVYAPWMTSVNSRLPAGSNYTMEICYNGNGNIEV